MAEKEINMSMEEWHKKVDEWVHRQNERIGKVYQPAIGLYPPKQKGLIVSENGINNRLASEDLIRHYADAVGDTNPLWRSQEYASTTRHGTIIAPPHFIDCIAPPSGMAMGFPNFGVPGMNPLNSGSKVTWFKTIRAGDEFSVHDRFWGVKELTKKERPMPRLFIFTGSREYINQRGEAVAMAEGGAMVLGMGPEMEVKSDSMKGIEKRRYTEEELQAVYDAYDNEVQRGADTLFWEDVQEGEAMPSIVKGPLSPMDSVAFFHVIGYTAAFRVNYLLLKANQGMGLVDPATNDIVGPALLHVSDAMAQAQGVPTAIGFAAQAEGNITHAITNWMGDDGFLKVLDCQARRINPMGDMNWIKGEVVKKYIENDEHLVDLKVWAENQDGIVHMPAQATVRLLSKSNM
jgi:acyl dehydratase